MPSRPPAVELLGGAKGKRKVIPSLLTPQPTKVKANAIIFRQGTVADAVFYIKRGRVQISVLSPHGKEATIAMLSRGNFFGEECLAHHSVRLASAVTTTESILVRLNKDLMIRALHEEPAFAGSFMSFLLARHIEISSDLIHQLFNSSEKRLARTLLMLANYGQENQSFTIPRISQRALAARVGTTRSRVTGFLKKFRGLGYIEGDRQIRVNDSLVRILMDE